jgi:predicted nucleic acid-binding protein
MIVVADTSPLNYLICLGKTDVLREIYDRILVPNAVLIEMQHPDAPPGVRAWASAPPAWLEARRVGQVDGSLAAELGLGEREAISLALEVKADVLLIDERVGRQEAEARQIEVAGTLAVLLQASLRGHFDFPEALEQLRRLGFRVSRPLEEAMLDKYERARRNVKGLGLRN